MSRNNYFWKEIHTIDIEYDSENVNNISKK